MSEKIVLSKEVFTALYNGNYEWSPSGRGKPSLNVGNYSPFYYKGVLIGLALLLLAVGILFVVRKDMNRGKRLWKKNRRP